MCDVELAWGKLLPFHAAALFVRREDGAGRVEWRREKQFGLPKAWGEIEQRFRAEFVWELFPEAVDRCALATDDVAYYATDPGSRTWIGFARAARPVEW